MISSEVQRTLVKSPPELWSELSDESTLARHLHEFGEIRITRRSAEERIEWEAERARGTILIKPSGWGTRVTLTVEREDASSAAPAPRAGTGTTPARPAQLVPTPLAAPQSLPPHAVPHPDTAPDPEPVTPGEHVVTPATPAPETGAPESSAVETAASADVASTPDLEDEAPPDVPGAERTSAAPSDAAPRRGLLARVMSRWQRALAWAERPSGAPSPAASAPAGEAADGAASSDATAASDSAEARDGATAGSGDGSDGGAAEIGSTASSDAFDADGRAAEDVDLPPGPPPAPRLPVHDSDPSLETSAASSASSAHAIQEPGMQAQPATAPERQTSAGAQQNEGAATERTEDRAANALSAELRAAEEAGVEGDEAALTAVLDRLGSAHHRPFSRA